MSGGPDPADEVALLDQARGGDRDAMDRLLRAHYDHVAAICRRMMNGAADAEDATQQALIAIVRGLPRFDGRSAVGTWMHRVTVNACLDEIRRRDRRPRLAATHPDSDSDELPTAGATDYGGPEDVALRLDLDAALATLPPEFRAPVVLRDVCGLDYAEIAAILELADGTVRSRISRGRSALRAALGNHEPGSDVQLTEP